MRLWNYIKEKMLQHPQKTIMTGKSSMTFEEICVFAETFAKKLTLPYYGIACGSEMSAAIAMLACFASGRTAIPIPTRYGPELYKRIVKKVAPPGIISDVTGQLEVIHTENGYSYTKGSTLNAAVILFTSGSTGEPKGVMLSEDNIINNIKSISSYLPINSNDTILIARSIYHSSVLTGEFLLSVCQGANVVFYLESFSPLAIINLFKKYNITVYGSTPTLMLALSKFIKNDSGASIRLISISGECVTDKMAKTIRSAFPTAEIYCGYGLSEASPRVAYLPANMFDEHPTAAGVPVEGVNIKIVDNNDKNLGRNNIGELLVRGRNVMIGYYKNPAQSKKVLRDGWLHTGDLAYIDENNLLYIKGRKDDMIVRAGMNIYPAEIEDALSRDPRIEQLVVYGYHDGNTQQVALKVQGSFSSIDEILSVCRKKLASYQMPSKIELVDSIQYGASGKIIKCKINKTE